MTIALRDVEGDSPGPRIAKEGPHRNRPERRRGRTAEARRPEEDCRKTRSTAPPGPRGHRNPPGARRRGVVLRRRASPPLHGTSHESQPQGLLGADPEASLLPLRWLDHAL